MEQKSKYEIYEQGRCLMVKCSRSAVGQARESGLSNVRTIRLTTNESTVSEEKTGEGELIY